MSVVPGLGAIAGAGAIPPPKIYRYLRYKCYTPGGRLAASHIAWSDDGGETLYPNVIGTMTSASAPAPLVLSGSGAYGGSWQMWYQYHANHGLHYISAAIGGGSVTLDLGAANLIALPDYIRFKNSIGYNGNVFTFEVSEDNSNWVLVYENPGVPGGHEDYTWTKSGGRVAT